MKYKRSNKLKEFFEGKYRMQSKQLKTLRQEIECKDEDIDKLNEQNDEQQINNEKLTIQITQFLEMNVNQSNAFDQERNTLQKEIDFLTNEQNTKELHLGDLKAKLSKRGDELQSLKTGLNQQI